MTFVLYKAQRYADFGYASGFKERHPLTQWFSCSRYFQRRDVAAAEQAERTQIKRQVFDLPKRNLQPLLPRWDWK